jgi:hypothetical protein
LFFNHPKGSPAVAEPNSRYIFCNRASDILDRATRTISKAPQRTGAKPSVVDHGTRKWSMAVIVKALNEHSEVPINPSNITAGRRGFPVRPARVRASRRRDSGRSFCSRLAVDRRGQVVDSGKECFQDRGTVRLVISDRQIDGRRLSLQGPADDRPWQEIFG